MISRNCNHTIHALTESGTLTGSWQIDESTKRPKVICGGCGRFYGYLADVKSRRRPPKDDEAIQQAYLEQQRRLSCPGCGEEPFLG